MVAGRPNGGMTKNERFPSTKREDRKKFGAYPYAVRVSWRTRCLLFSVAAAQLLFTSTSDASPVDFARDVAPILKSSCLPCHGPIKHRGGFRVDTHDTFMAEGDDGPRVQTGHPENSLLIKLVSNPDPTERMPPEEREGLTPAQIDVLKRWVAQGAVWPKGLQLVDAAAPQNHWAFVGPQRPQLPDAAALAVGPVQNPIDAFVLQKVKAQGLTPSPAADRNTLLRRLWLDLVGLVPPVAAVDAFVHDTRKDATKRAVETLLASPHFGEKWARDWLDAARYADSDGFEKDKRRSIWPYRDWVVQALNRDMPYNQFIVEQVAGDLLPGAALAQKVATGFLRNSQINEEGGADPEQFRVEALFERVEILGRSVLGVTVQCAQCHDHKFDPIKQEDYFRMFAALNQNDETSLEVASAQQANQRRKVLASIDDSVARIKAASPSWSNQLSTWRSKILSSARPDWKVVQAPFIDETTGGQKYARLADGSFRAEGYAPTRHEAQVKVASPVKSVAAIRLELLTDPNLPLGGPGRAANGTGALTELRLQVVSTNDPVPTPDGAKRRLLKFAFARSDLELPETPLAAVFDNKKGRARFTGPAAFAIDDNDDTAWGIDAGPGRRNVDHTYIAVLQQPVALAADEMLVVHLVQNHGGWNSDDVQNNNLGRFRIAVSATAPAKNEMVFSPSQWSALNASPGHLNATQSKLVFDMFRNTVKGWQKNNDEVARLWSQYPEVTPTLTLAQRSEARQTHIFERGDFLKPGKAVAPGALPLLAPAVPTNTPLTRLELARWMVDPRSPTAARVIVNRIWQSYFGEGLHSTPEDFGTQAPPPSHPELLDFLATELVSHGYSLKHIHSLIVNCATYQQASISTPQQLERDPQNVWLSRGPRMRVQAEVVRDIALASSGLLDTSMGGAPVMPPAPAFLFLPPSSYGPFPWTDATGTSQYRRSLYVFRRRSTPFPTLALFDGPNGDSACVRRNRSNSPLQALVTLNEPMFLQAARALAHQMVSSPAGNAGERLRFGFRRVLSREPKSGELRSLQAFLDQQRQRVSEGWVDAQEVGSAGAPTTLPKGTTPTELAAYAMVARVLLNLDEAVTKE